MKGTMKKDTKSKKVSAPMVDLEVGGMSRAAFDALERKWRAEDALRTLSDAERVKKDKALMADVEKARQAKMRDLESIKVEVSPRTIGK